MRPDAQRYDERPYDQPRRDDRYDEYEDRRPARRPAAYDDYDQTPRRRPAATPVRRRRKVWPWVVLGLVLLPVLGVVGCVAIIGGAATAVDNARQGGTVAIGDTFTYQSGLGLSVSAPIPHSESNQFIVDPGNSAHEVTVTITNGTSTPVSAYLIQINATVNNAPAQQVFDETILPNQDIAPGQTLAIPFRFQVPDGTAGSLQIAVTDTFNEPVFFTGQLG